MARELRAFDGDEFRLLCAHCETMWSTTIVPAECPTCGAVVTIRLLRKPVGIVTEGER